MSSTDSPSPASISPAPSPLRSPPASPPPAPASTSPPSPPDSPPPAPVAAPHPGSPAAAPPLAPVQAQFQAPLAPVQAQFQAQGPVASPPSGWLGRLPTGIMVLIQLVSAYSNVLYRKAAAAGMDITILSALRLIFGCALLVPVAFFAERGTRTPITRKVLALTFFGGLFGGPVVQNLYVASLINVPVAIVSAIWILNPFFTFLIALPLGLEQFKMGQLSHWIKLTGMLLCLGGAMGMTLFKSLVIELKTPTHHPAGHRFVSHHYNMAIGLPMAVGSCLSSVISIIIQAHTIDIYPHFMTCTALTSFFGAVQGLVYGLIVDHHPKEWRLRWDIRLLTVLYVGILSYGVCSLLMSYCMKKKGPLFVAAFNPLGLIASALFGTVFLDEKMHIGSVMFGIFILVGSYIFLYGRSVEEKEARRIAEREAA